MFYLILFGLLSKIISYQRKTTNFFFEHIFVCNEFSYVNLNVSNLHHHLLHKHISLFSQLKFQMLLRWGGKLNISHKALCIIKIEPYLDCICIIIVYKQLIMFCGKNLIYFKRYLFFIIIIKRLINLNIMYLN